MQKNPLGKRLTFYVGLIGAVVAVIEFTEMLGLTLGSEYVIATICLISVLFVPGFLSDLKQRKCTKYQGLGVVFRPFRSNSDDEKDSGLVNRNYVTKKLSDRLIASSQKHVLLVAPSGIGKSTLIRFFLKPRMEAKQWKFIKEFDQYNTISEKVLFSLMEYIEDHHLKATISELTKDNFLLSKSSKEQLNAELSTIIQSINPQDGGIVLVFDQLERIFLQSTSNTSNDTSRVSEDIRVFKQILVELKRNSKIRTLLSIRSEYVDRSLSSIIDDDDYDDTVTNSIDYFVLKGLNSSDDADGISKIFNSDLLQSDRKFYDHFRKVTNVDAPEQSNSFLFSLMGYIFEKYRHKKNVYNRLMKEGVTSDNIVKLYLDIVFEGYVAKEAADERYIFDSILFTLACENRKMGRACSKEQLILLSHCPADIASNLLVYLTDINLLKQETNNGTGDPEYRISHDKISDFLDNNITKEIHSVESLRTLVSNTSSTERSALVSVKSFPKYIDYSGLNGINNSISYGAVILFCLFGFFRLLEPHQLYTSLSSLLYTNAFQVLYEDFLFLGYFYNNDLEYYHSWAMYLPHFIAHLVWVSYIDRMNRSYLQYVTTGWLRFLCSLLPAMGTVLGISVAYCPELFVFPIVAIGFIFGIILFYLSYTKKYEGYSRDKTRGWGGNSAINVLVVLFLALFLFAPLFEPEQMAENMSWQPSVPFLSSFMSFINSIFTILNGTEAVDFPETISNIWLLVLAQSLMMVWYWKHIYKEQNVPKVWSGRLAIYDNGYIKTGSSQQYD